ncbi:MAG: hypothetical protein P4M01_01075 [Acidobacteriota bacterium]|nr:hypothetical protein [Acidobacteriota bacterium]
MNPSILDAPQPQEDRGHLFWKALWTAIVVVLGLFLGLISAFIAALFFGWIGIC